jgi:hypothetical protein
LTKEKGGRKNWEQVQAAPWGVKATASLGRNLADPAYHQMGQEEINHIILTCIDGGQLDEKEVS